MTSLALLADTTVVVFACSLIFVSLSVLMHLPLCAKDYCVMGILVYSTKFFRRIIEPRHVISNNVAF